MYIEAWLWRNLVPNSFSKISKTYEKVACFFVRAAFKRHICELRFTLNTKFISSDDFLQSL